MTQLRRLLGLALLFAVVTLVGCGDGGSGVVPKAPDNAPKLEPKTPGAGGGGPAGGKTGNA